MQPPTTQPEDVKKDMAEIIKNSPFGHLQYISLSITTTMTYNPGGNHLVVLRVNFGICSTIDKLYDLYSLKFLSSNSFGLFAAHLLTKPT